MSELLSNKTPEENTEINPESSADSLEKEKSFEKHMAENEKDKQDEGLSDREKFIKKAGEEYRRKADEKMKLAEELIKRGDLYAANLVMKGEPDNKDGMYQGLEAYGGHGLADHKAKEVGDKTGWDYSVGGYKKLAAKKEAEAAELYDAEQKMFAELDKMENEGFSSEMIEQAKSDIERDYRLKIAKKLELARKLVSDGELYAAGLVMHGEPDDKKKMYQGLEAYGGHGIADHKAKEYGDTTGWEFSIDGYKMLLEKEELKNKEMASGQEELLKELGKM